MTAHLCWTFDKEYVDIGTGELMLLILSSDIDQYFPPTSGEGMGKSHMGVVGVSLYFPAMRNIYQGMQESATISTYPISIS